MAEVINALADPAEDRRTAAARCLGELVRKMGERVLHRMLPIMRESMASDSASTRQGVCAGLREVLEAATRHQLGEHLPDILPPIQAALCDSDPSVREAAGAAFGVLFRGGAHSAVDGVVPSLLAGLDSEAHYSASVEGLRVIMGVRPATFNGVAPKLLRPPVTSSSLRALGELAGVAGPALPSHLPAILSTCLAIASKPNDHRAPAAEEAALRVAQAAGEEGLPSLVEELGRALEDASGRAPGAAALVAGYCRAATGDRREGLQGHVDGLMTVGGTVGGGVPAA
ncbi:Translational activator GCN1 [Monoraphidium neglectum]|uniref:Translational activator GCN1 n=1 Tax=Monoraphidium neglectum TaxID=145388 RepID=A0A0D2K9X0_9CHLO|nr:Translational activator GCN1 [Monoraphidium neglectum]KIY92858.1 Translational activator GCN1 [Monoraphidium neglectum]|eukprot:XP_013891878.1 Translational activator GCN1 [Monoraphidium neglectum]